MTRPGLILALDTSMGACSVALDDPSAPERSLSLVRPMLRGQAEALVPLVGELLDRTGVDPRSVEAVAVTVGPGSFTGLRVGLSTARGLALAMGCPVLGLTTFEVLADAALDARPDARVEVLIDTKRGDAYCQAFQGRTPTGLPAALGEGAVVPRTLEREAVLLVDGEPLESDAILYPDPRRLARLARSEQRPAPTTPLYLRSADATPAPNGGRLWS
ncbi:tRNA (adenosine(37)-N6)-threonylcarbamoyltransferase complex dimerization subunit type 1 TsaB [Phaeovibrio sulfidiphilus]|uniref:tRNA (Adenosine(37)-N6)-threonylcarbamoyltransferase complex dimerization subunit type 1 TsaB n=1 Tax=Phaeovibrio sulfidiphilus TaxID=1220600 RepID=A0A8J6YQB8_9PROT|nr:tRNA (adenosine(37)-N6)-threonylcarbamoyltransferase complex dimerization subunit type 1 TsaB [Phaeovibrio sulfidiphilus]MBE1237342.1 tRNA (adenosine(37)-N6)-threonylcarbamoyltransferase complex dimerization subunit type 1 TsaB [Phaeovibrio sulfidiphilus]